MIYLVEWEVSSLPSPLGGREGIIMITIIWIKAVVIIVVMIINSIILIIRITIVTSISVSITDDSVVVAGLAHKDTGRQVLSSFLE